MSTRKQIVILGGGFGGMYAAIHLEKQFKRDPTVEITLVNRENFFLFTPMLHEVASCDLSITHIVNPVRKLLKKSKFFAGEVDAINLETKTVTVSHGDDHHQHELAYDHLVIALGSVTNFYGLPGLEENSLTMKSLGDAIHLRNHIIRSLEEADAECAAANRSQLLSFVVAGGGFAGVETVAAINDFVRDALPFYRNLSENQVQTVLVHSGPALLPELGEQLGKYAEKILVSRGVKVHLDAKVASFQGGEVVLNNGTCFPASTLVWTAGTSVNPMIPLLPCGKDRGRVRANEFLEVAGWEGVWTLGDCASIADPATGKPYPPTAQHAIRQGKILAHNLACKIRGGEMKPFKFKTIGLLATTGRRTGVAQILGVNFSGWFAWWLWRTIYLSKLPGVEKKLRVTLDWTLDLMFSKDIVQFLALRTPMTQHMNEEMPVVELNALPKATQ